MLYRVGTKEQAFELIGTLPKEVVYEVIKGIEVLDSVYGADRDYLEVGGYSVVAETYEDLYVIKDIVDYDSHPCEWAYRIVSEVNYVSALYLMNNEYSVMVFMPESFAPDDILEELD